MLIPISLFAVVFFVLFLLALRASLKKDQAGRLLVSTIAQQKGDLAFCQDMLHKTIASYEGQIGELRHTIEAKDRDLASFVHRHSFTIRGRETPHAGAPLLDVQCGCGARHFVTAEQWGRLFGADKPEE